LLEWWQAFQRRDFAAVTVRTSARTLDRIGQATLEDLVKKVGPALQGIRPVGSIDNGRNTEVRAMLLTFPELDASGLPTGTPTGAPTTFSMTFENGLWRFDEPAFLASVIEQQPERGAD
jgi:hypothetical protein